LAIFRLNARHRTRNAGRGRMQNLIEMFSLENPVWEAGTPSRAARIPSATCF
jgi:hypothetical protein